MHENENDNIRLIYLAVFYYMELNIARMLHDLNIKYDYDINILNDRLAKIEAATETTLDEQQRIAVRSSI